MKNGGDLQRAKRVCGQRGIPEGEVGRGWVRYRVLAGDGSVNLSVATLELLMTCSFIWSAHHSPLASFAWITYPKDVIC